MLHGNILSQSMHEYARVLKKANTMLTMLFNLSVTSIDLLIIVIITCSKKILYSYSRTKILNYHIIYLLDLLK